MNKCYRVWYKTGAAVLVDAETQNEARDQAEKLYHKNSPKFPAHRKMVKSVECLSNEHPHGGEEGRKMKEIIERKNGKTMWQWQDAEGRTVYAVTTDRDGVAVEPTGNLYYHSRRAARENS